MLQRVCELFVLGIIGLIYPYADSPFITPGAFNTHNGLAASQMALPKSSVGSMGDKHQRVCELFVLGESVTNTPMPMLHLPLQGLMHPKVI